MIQLPFFFALYFHFLTLKYVPILNVVQKHMYPLSCAIEISASRTCWGPECDFKKWGCRWQWRICVKMTPSLCGRGFADTPQKYAKLTLDGSRQNSARLSNRPLRVHWWLWICVKVSSSPVGVVRWTDRHETRHVWQVPTRSLVAMIFC